MWLQEVQLQVQSRTRCLKAVMEEWHAAAAFQAYSQHILAACVARMKGQAVAAAFDTWRYEVLACWAACLILLCSPVPLRLRQHGLRHCLWVLAYPSTELQGGMPGGDQAWNGLLRAV